MLSLVAYWDEKKIKKKQKSLKIHLHAIATYNNIANYIYIPKKVIGIGNWFFTLYISEHMRPIY